MVRRCLLIVALGLGPALGDEPGAPGVISAETARHRIAGVLADAAGGVGSAEDRIGVLAEIAERSEDRALGAIAAFNAGTMALEAGDPRAPDLLRRAERMADNPALRAAARYNLGHAMLPKEDAPPARSAEAGERAEAMRRAAGLFRSVLDIDPSHRDAAANTERLRRQAQTLEEQQAAMQAQEQAMQELAEALSRLAEQQQEQASESESSAARGDEPGEEALGDQRSLSEQTRDAADRADQAGADESVREAIERARAAQRGAEEALDRDDAAEAAARQREAADSLRSAAEQAQRGAGEAGEGPGQPGAADEIPARPDQAEPSDAEGEPTDGPEFESQIDPLAEALLDKERRERERRSEYLQRGRQQQVERDW
ncbi:MAG: hypothetical protein LAT64_07870 [Phycisphaerales bacterium]|nr:hypothetical protein [Planctomycetota bacterium]MCH8508672.1 hypothetical protein [Phycisphaerales bacterium]